MQRNSDLSPIVIKEELIPIVRDSEESIGSFVSGAQTDNGPFHPGLASAQNLFRNNEVRFFHLDEVVNTFNRPKDESLKRKTVFGAKEKSPTLFKAIKQSESSSIHSTSLKTTELRNGKRISGSGKDKPDALNDKRQSNRIFWMKNSLYRSSQAIPGVKSTVSHGGEPLSSLNQSQGEHSKQLKPSFK